MAKNQRENCPASRLSIRQVRNKSKSKKEQRNDVAEWMIAWLARWLDGLPTGSLTVTASASKRRLQYIILICQ